MKVTWVLSEIDPVYQTVQVIAVYGAKGTANLYMKRCTENLSDQMKDRGVSYRVDRFEVGKLYFRESA